MSRTAFIVGINTYERAGRLYSCVADAVAMEKALRLNKDGQKNFDCHLFPDKTDDDLPITRPRLRRTLEKIFSLKGEILLYFSGHGVFGSEGGFLCTTDATENDWGIPMQAIVDLAVNSPASQILLILDCCHSGAMGNPAMLNVNVRNNPLSVLRENMTVIAASRHTEPAVERGGHGLFTGALLDGLNGAAADHFGFVTAPALYMYASPRFTAIEQRPVYKTNSSEVFLVRQCEPLIAAFELRRLIDYFKERDDKFPLDPDYEPEDEHGNVKQPVDEVKVEIAQLFKKYRDVGLLRPSPPHFQLYWAARRRGTAELTMRGKEYWWLLYHKKI